MRCLPENPYIPSSEIPSRYAVAHEALPSILTQRREVPCALAATVARATHPDAAGRFPSAQALQLHLKAVLGEMARPTTPISGLVVQRLDVNANREANPDRGRAVVVAGTPRLRLCAEGWVPDDSGLEYPRSPQGREMVFGEN